MKIYDTLTHDLQELEPLKKSEIKMYVCGPTVYDEPHIGHARSAYIFDVIRRYLIYKKYKVTFVRNVTDVDDKIIDKARKKYPGEDLKEAVLKVSREYLDVYHEDMKALGILPPDKEPKATEYIDKMKKFISQLIEKGVAYEAEGDVYFDITKAKNYGKLSHQNLDELKTGTRIQPGENKKNALDFALWKKAKENEPSWPSPCSPQDKGRPGWHIECSVMSSDILGDEFDIHGGGIDLIFPHHENEIAQSEGAGKKFARHWMHNGLLTINGQKMAKSLGNFITIKNFIEKYKDADILKLIFLSAHYSSPIDFNDEKIQEAIAILQKFKTFITLIDLPILYPSKSQKKGSSKLERVIEDKKAKFITSMDNNFNTPEALATLFEIIYETYACTNGQPRKLEVSFLKELKKTFIELGNVLGLSFDQLTIEERRKKMDPAFVRYIESKKEERDKARKAKDFKKADIIREELYKKGISLEDTEEGTIW